MMHFAGLSLVGGRAQKDMRIAHIVLLGPKSIPCRPNYAASSATITQTLARPRAPNRSVAAHLIARKAGNIAVFNADKPQLGRLVVSAEWAEEFASIHRG